MCVVLSGRTNGLMKRCSWERWRGDEQYQAGRFQNLGRTTSFWLDVAAVRKPKRWNPNERPASCLDVLYAQLQGFHETGHCPSS